MKVETCALAPEDCLIARPRKFSHSGAGFWLEWLLHGFWLEWLLHGNAEEQEEEEEKEEEEPEETEEDEDEDGGG